MINYLLIRLLKSLRLLSILTLLLYIIYLGWRLRLLSQKKVDEIFRSIIRDSFPEYTEIESVYGDIVDYIYVKDSE